MSFRILRLSFFFFFNDTATTEIYTLSLHDALPISPVSLSVTRPTMLPVTSCAMAGPAASRAKRDRKSTRLNSSHQIISYAVFCLKKKKTKKNSYDREHVQILTQSTAPLTLSH